MALQQDYAYSITCYMPWNERRVAPWRKTITDDGEGIGKRQEGEGTGQHGESDQGNSTPYPVRTNWLALRTTVSQG